MPSNVVRFEQFMYLTLGLGVINSALQFQSLVSQAGPAFTLAVQAVVFGIMVLLIWLIARRRAGWARWVLLASFALGAVPFLMILGDTIRINLISGLISISQLIIQAIALYLIFTGNAVAWFKKLPQ